LPANSARQTSWLQNYKKTLQSAGSKTPNYGGVLVDLVDLVDL
jgi:hypothetical protein